MLTLDPMTDAAFDRYLAIVIADYASQGAQATGMAPQEALEYARSQITGLLPDGNRTPGQHFRSLVTTAGDEIGIVWYADQLEEDPPRAFLYDIRVDESHRGTGVGTTAMELLHEEVRRRGAAELMLHVFAHNAGAIRLYEKLGYRVLDEGKVGMHMVKRL